MQLKLCYLMYTVLASHKSINQTFYSTIYLLTRSFYTENEILSDAHEAAFLRAPFCLALFGFTADFGKLLCNLCRFMRGALHCAPLKRTLELNVGRELIGFVVSRITAGGYQPIAGLGTCDRSFGKVQMIVENTNFDKPSTALHCNVSGFQRTTPFLIVHWTNSFDASPVVQATSHLVWSSLLQLNVNPCAR